MKKKLFLSILLIILLVFIDQLTKYIIIQNFDLHEEKSLIGDILVLTYIRNSGAAWGSLSGKTILLLVFTFIIFILLFRVYIRIWDNPRFKPVRICLLFVIGGAIGNMIDRIRLNYVIDFIYFKFIKFPVFNFADICVTLSVILIVLLFIFKYNDDDYDVMLGKKKKEKIKEDVKNLKENHSDEEE